MILLLCVIIPIFAFIFESYPRFINRKMGVDIWTHLIYLKEYYKQKGIPKKIENGFLIPGTYDYPPTFIFIVSKFPFKLVEKYEFLFSPFFDAIHLILIFFIVNLLTGNIFIALLTQLLYAFTPIIILENSYATPRSLGYTLFTVVFMSLFLYQLTGGYYLFLLSVVAGSLIFLSHRFTTQGFLFFSIFFSLIEGNPVYFYVFFLSFIIALIVSRGFYIEVLKGHLGNLIFWYKNIDYRFYHQVKGSYSDFKTEDFLFKMYNQFLKFPPFVLSIANPWTLPVIFIFFFQMPQDQIMQQLVLWVIFSYTLALLTTWVPFLRFLGEAQRYLELSVFPAAFLSVTLLSKYLNTNLSSLLIVLYTTFIIFSFVTTVIIQRKAMINDKLRTLTPGMEKMFSYLKSLKQKPKLLCIPHQITTNTIYHTGCQVLVNADYKSIQKISDIYPYFKMPIDKIMKKYNLDMILLNVEYADISDLKLKKYKVVKEVENFLLINPLI